MQSDLSFSLLDPGRRCGRGEVRFLTIIIFTNPIIIMIMISIIDKNFFKLFKEEEEAQYMEEQVAEVTTEGTGFVDHHHCHHHRRQYHHHHLYYKSNNPRNKKNGRQDWLSDTGAIKVKSYKADEN